VDRHSLPLAVIGHRPLAISRRNQHSFHERFFET
jgi:hypothetical protein